MVIVVYPKNWGDDVTKFNPRYNRSVRREVFTGSE